MNKNFFCVLFLLIFSCTVLFAQTSSASSSPGENLTLKIAVMGQGTELYFWWGHIALIIEDSTPDASPNSRFYDYGIFSFDYDGFFYNFAFGRLLYSCAVTSTERNLTGYVRTNRSIKIYTLDVPPETRVKVRDFAEFNVLPENRYYYYHHFKDNCSTRIRDIIDITTDGQFKEHFEHMPGRYTLRQHVRRHTWFSPAVDWFLNFLMGQVIDTGITVWDEMFLPEEVGNRIEDFFYYDINGDRRQLVTLVETFYEADNRPGVLDVPRKQWPIQLVFSLGLSVIFGFFFFLQHRKIKAGKILAGISMSLCGFIFGISGLLLYFMSIFTNHDYTYQNFNMIFCTPLLLAAIPLGILYISTKKPDKQLFYDTLLRIVWLLTVLGIFISMILKLLPGVYQANLTDQMLMLPIALVFALHPFTLKDVINRYIFRSVNKSNKIKK